MKSAFVNQNVSFLDSCKIKGIDPGTCEVYNALEGEFKKAVEKNVHLLVYLHKWMKRSRLGLPEYVVQLSRKLGKLRKVNLIYPVGDPIFIHIYRLFDSEVKKYHPIEPSLPIEKKHILQEVEDKIAIYIDEEWEVDTDEKRIVALEKLLQMVISIGDTQEEEEETEENEALPEFLATQIGKNKKTKKKKKEKRNKKGKIVVDKETYELLWYELLREKIGLGLLEPLIRDPYIEDISCDGVGPIFIAHKVFGSLESTITFRSHEELNEFVIQLSERIGRPVSFRTPIVDASLPDGSRLNIVFGNDISRKGTNFTIRKFNEVPLSITQLINFGTLNAKMAAYLWMLLYEGSSIFVSGETASGKTTTLNAMTVFIDPDWKIISIEDTPEVVLPHPNWITEVSRQTRDEKATVDLYALLKAALRQRPNYIIVGEIRGVEGHVAFQAMQTGHPVLSTFHASTVEKLIQRITGHPIDVPKTYIDNLNAIIIQSSVRNPVTGRIDRRVLSINEIIGYDPIEKRFNFVELFVWDPVTDQFIFRGVGNSYLLEYKIAPRHGIPRKDVRKIYDELDIRALFLQTMVEKGIMNYYDVWQVIKRACKMKIEDALEDLKRGRLLRVEG